MKAAVEVISDSAGQTRELGERLARLLRAGDVVALCGRLGAGKTELVKGLARGLEVPDDEPVVSPTFVLIREYAGRLPLVHCDAYRVGSATELWDAGLGERLELADAVVVIEWADRVEALLPEHAIRIEIDAPTATRRRFRITAPRAALLDELK